MNNSRRTIRKVAAPNQLVIDEQFWPVLLATFLLCGFVMGTVAAYLPFDAKHWWQNATTWLFIIPILACLAVWLLRYLPSRLVRRALQISFLLGLLLHVILLVVSLESSIFGTLFQPVARKELRQPRRELRVVNDYQPHQLDQRRRQQQDFTRPLETVVPEPQPEEVVRQPELAVPIQTDSRPMSAPRTPREIQQNAIERPAPAESRPRQSESLSKLSRQTAEIEFKHSAAVHIPAPTPATAQSSALTARSDSLRQRSTTVETVQAQKASQPSASAAQTVPRIARRATENSPTVETRSAPTLPRQLARPTSVPRADVRTGDNPSISRQTAATDLEPARTTARQQLTASPLQSRTADAPIVPPSTSTPSPARQRDQPSPNEPQLAQTPVPVANRQPRTTDRPDAATAAPILIRDGQPAAESARNMEAPASTVARAATSRATTPETNSANAPSATPNPTAAPVARRTPAAAPATNAVASSPTPRTGTTATIANQATSVAVPTQSAAREAAGGAALASGAPGIQQPSARGSAGPSTGATAAVAPSNAPAIARSNERAQAAAGTGGPAVSHTANTLPRSAQRSEVARSTTLAEIPRSATAEAGSAEPQARPSRFAMTQSLSGVAGVGQTANLDRSPSTPGSPATTATGSARRAEASQNTPPGPSLAPSATALTRRSLVGADRPQASLRASTDAVSEASGTERPSELNSTASASLVRQDANAKAGEVTAAKGNIDIDLGPTRVADAGGFERASGGGQPVVNLESESTNLARTRNGGSAPTTLSTTVVDTISSSPASGGQPTTGELAAGGTETRQTTSAGAAGSVTPNSAGEPALGASGEATARAMPAGVTRSNLAANVPSVEEGGATSPGTEQRESQRQVGRTSGAAEPAGSMAGPVPLPNATANGAEPAGESPTLAAAGGTGVSRQTRNDSVRVPGTADQVGSSVPVSGGDVLGEATLERAEAADALAGPQIQGSGTGNPRRSTPARELATNVTADMATIAGAPGSSGSPRGSEHLAEGGEPAAAATGVVTRTSRNTAGAGAGDLTRDAPPESGVDMLAGAAARSNVNGDTPAVGSATVSGAPLQRAGRSQFEGSPTTTTVASTPSTPTSTAIPDGNPTEPGMGVGQFTARQQSAAAIPIEVASVDGPGGLGDRIAIDVGVNSRLATPDSLEVQSTPARFVRQEIGGAPKLNTSATYAADAFRNRAPAKTESPSSGGSGGGGPQTEESIELGLAYLAKRQLADGSWTLRSATESVQLASDTAATGLCLLAFQGAGYSHREHKYAARIGAGIEYLVKNQKPDGDLFVPLDDVSNRSVWLYSHAIATIALCEAYGMTHDPKLQEPAQKALDFIVATQDPKGGGWRYQPGMESDTSVTGWMMMALKSGELASLKVSRSTYDKIGKWLDSAQGSEDEQHLYRYNPLAPDTDTQRHGRATTPTMTAVGLLMRLYGGWRRDHPRMIAGADYLRQNLPAVGTMREPLRDTYYWYYGTQVMFHMGGSAWEEWNSQLHPLLIGSQIKQGESAGSWAPRTPVPDRWAPHAGRLYVTTMNLLSLEVTYRHLPLYVETAK